jgi:Ca-activated chloride channel family protein
MDRPPLRVNQQERWAGAVSVALGVVLAPLTLGGCLVASDEPPPEDEVAGESRMVSMEQQKGEAEERMDEPTLDEDGEMNRDSRKEPAAPPPSSQPVSPSTPAAEPSPEPDVAVSGHTGTDQAFGNSPEEALDDLMDAVSEGGRLGSAGGTAGPRRVRRMRRRRPSGTSMSTGLGLSGLGRGGGARAAATDSAGDALSNLMAEAQHGLVVTSTSTTAISWGGDKHRPKRCSDASDHLLDTRRAVWRERLEQESSASGWVEVYRRAIRQCEADSFRDKRALLILVLNRAGSIRSMANVYSLMTGSGVRAWLRGAILRRVRSPQDLRIVRDTMGLTQSVDWELVERLIERAPNVRARIRVLRDLLEQNSTSFELKLRLLEELERGDHKAEARRMADRLRVDPLADAGVRTVLGEMFLRFGDEVEARRAFSEIVEFAPLDELARRRLGDLYRAHGWFEDAYRQYRTLSEIRPDDPSVLLLLAQAAAGAGRVDEALRLERRLAETSEPGESVGVARTAILWSSVRYAKLRRVAEEVYDREKLQALLSRRRASGVLREAGGLRASLVWSHPDAQLSLWAAHPGLGLSRPVDIAPEYGIEVFDVKEPEQGTYRLEVRRAAAGKGREHMLAVDAELVLVWNEGRDDEKVEVVPLRFEGDRLAMAWTVTGSELMEAQPSPEATGREP